MNQEFLGYHSEWNMGSPGGWDYQRMAQIIGKYSWEEIRKKKDIGIELDFDDPILNPVTNFRELLVRAHKNNFPGEVPSIALVAEKETLDKVGENIRFVEYLNSLPNIKAVLTDPSELRIKDDHVYVGDDKITSIFLDLNSDVIVKLKKKQNVDALLKAIENKIVTNPKGMEPIGAKGVFEVITSIYKDKLSKTTVKRTPWTRQFYTRQTIGPKGEDIPDLVKWARDNWTSVILKPVHGHSGKGIIIGYKEPDKERGIKQALDAGDYIIQPLVPLDIWAEEFPWIDRQNKRLFLKRWQTDFRCFITDIGLIGFVTRFGGVPTNVGSGGGIQSTAILRSHIKLKEAVNAINDAILSLGYDFIAKLQERLDRKSVEIGSVYLLGPIMCTLRPRIITEDHVRQLKEYAGNLWNDALILERLWLKGELSKYVQISPEEEAIARLAPWQGKPALIASDGLFGF